MKLQVSFDTIHLDQALEIAAQIVHQTDILEIGTLLLYSSGISAVERFKTAFPDKKILADAKIVDRAKDSVQLFAQAGADWITVMAGSTPNAIHIACTTAHEQNKKIMLDLLDAQSIGQSAMEAKNLGADAILVHQPHDDSTSFVFAETWEMVRGNTDLPIYVSARIKRDTIDEILLLKPDGIILGKAVTQATDPAQEMAFFREKVDL